MRERRRAIELSQGEKKRRDPHQFQATSGREKSKGVALYGGLVKRGEKLSEISFARQRKEGGGVVATVR